MHFIKPPQLTGMNGSREVISWPDIFDMIHIQVQKIEVAWNFLGVSEKMFWNVKHTYRPRYHNYMKGHLCSAFPPGLLDQNWKSRRREITVQRSKRWLSWFAPLLALILEDLWGQRLGLSSSLLYSQSLYLLHIYNNYSRNICWLTN